MVLRSGSKRRPLIGDRRSPPETPPWLAHAADGAMRTG
jgi:hypothetical protein